MEKHIPIHVIMQMIEGLARIAEEMQIEDQVRLQNYLIMALTNLVEEIANN